MVCTTFSFWSKCFSSYYKGVSVESHPSKLVGSTGSGNRFFDFDMLAEVRLLSTTNILYFNLCSLRNWHCHCVQLNLWWLCFWHFHKWQITALVTTNLNKVIDVNYYPIENAKRSNLRHRPIGIGVQGLADTFILLGMAFDSPEVNLLPGLLFIIVLFGLQSDCLLGYECRLSNWTKRYLRLFTIMHWKLHVIWLQKKVPMRHIVVVL